MARGDVPSADSSVVSCVVCGRQLSEKDVKDGTRSVVVVCEHGSSYVACGGCDVEARHMIRRHDRTGLPVRSFRPVIS